MGKRTCPGLITDVTLGKQKGEQQGFVACCCGDGETGNVNGGCEEQLRALGQRSNTKSGCWGDEMSANFSLSLLPGCSQSFAASWERDATACLPDCTGPGWAEGPRGTGSPLLLWDLQGWDSKEDSGNLS